MAETITLETVLAHLPPIEAQKYIFRRLDFETLKSARMVNKQWQHLADPLIEFQLTLSDKTKSNVMNFGADRKVGTLSTTIFQGAYPPEGIQLNVQNVQIIVQLLEDPFSLLKAKKGAINQPTTQNVGISESNLRRLVSDFRFIQKFHLASVAVRTFSNPQRTLFKLYLPNLKELVVTFFDSGFHQLLPFLKNYFPSLKRVSIANVAMRRRERTTAYSWIFGFLARHHHLLEDVTLIFPEGIRSNDRTWTLYDGRGHSQRRNRRHPPPPVKDHKMPQVAYELVKTKLEKMQLNKFIWDLSMMEGSSRFDLGTTLFQSQTKLQELHLDNLRGPTDSIWNKLGTILGSCSETLVTVSISGCFCSSFPLGTNNTFNCSWIKNCVGLKSLEVVICGMYVQNIEDLPKSITSINLGHMLRQDQIEYLALHLVNLDSWVLPQKGSILHPAVPRISLYLFKSILHLPKLESLSVYTECSDAQEILDFVGTEEGIQLCQFWSIFDPPRAGDMTFHICRNKFSMDHNQLKGFIDSNRPDPAAMADNNNNIIIEHFVRYLFEEGNVEHWIALED